MSRLRSGARLWLYHSLNKAETRPPSPDSTEQITLISPGGHEFHSEYFSYQLSMNPCSVFGMSLGSLDMYASLAWSWTQRGNRRPLWRPSIWFIPPPFLVFLIGLW